jgi:hypothetical protein
MKMLSIYRKIFRIIEGYDSKTKSLRDAVDATYEDLHVIGNLWDNMEYILAEQVNENNSTLLKKEEISCINNLKKIFLAMLEEDSITYQKSVDDFVSDRIDLKYLLQEVLPNELSADVLENSKATLDDLDNILTAQSLELPEKILFTQLPPVERTVVLDALRDIEKEVAMGTSQGIPPAGAWHGTRKMR